MLLPNQQYTVPIKSGARRILGSSVVTGDAIPMVVDTDIGNDIDDVLAFYAIAALQKDKIVSLEAVLISNNNPLSIVFLHELMRGLNLNCPIYFLGKSPIGSSERYLNLATEMQVDEIFANASAFNLFTEVDNYLLEALRRSRIVMIGFSSNIASIISTNRGRNALEQNGSIYLMAGNFRYKSSEFNIRMDPSAFKKINNFDKVDKYFVDFPVGESVCFDGDVIYSSRERLQTELGMKAYASFRRWFYDRPLWDPCTIIAAITTKGSMFGWQRGTVELDRRNVTHFHPDDAGRSFRAELVGCTSSKIKNILRECCF